ncbi:hypothetical protein [Bandra megavirus]|uniref:2OG-Fe(II) oxygenase n=1 Tax=Bandra megavirus TaxID=2071566 RepID=A0A2K9V996_9VIRU|nr:hypothetical protein [Bandra megavirus]
MATYTITFGDQAENHVGMQKIGQIANKGYDLSDLGIIRDKLKYNNIYSEIVDLNSTLLDYGIEPDIEAYILIIPNGINLLLNNESASMDLYNQLSDLKWDTKAYMYGRVVNKNARYNLCFGNEKQKSNYELGLGTIVKFSNVPVLYQLYQKIKKLTGDDLVGEGNYYYDVTKCGIGYHGDSERRKVIGIRIGASLSLVYQWYHDSKPIGDPICFEFIDSDIYIMSEKATGNDWKHRSKYTLRHAAGCDKFTKIH